MADSQSLPRTLQTLSKSLTKTNATREAEEKSSEQWLSDLKKEMEKTVAGVEKAGQKGGEKHVGTKRKTSGDLEREREWRGKFVGVIDDVLAGGSEKKQKTGRAVEDNKERAGKLLATEEAAARLANNKAAVGNMRNEAFKLIEAYEEAERTIKAAADATHGLAEQVRKDIEDANERCKMEIEAEHAKTEEELRKMLTGRKGDWVRTWKGVERAVDEIEGVVGRERRR